MQLLHALCLGLQPLRVVGETRIIARLCGVVLDLLRVDLPVQLHLCLEHLEHLFLKRIRPLGLERLELRKLEHLRLEHRRLCRLAARLACRGNVRLCLAHRSIQLRHVLRLGCETRIIAHCSGVVLALRRIDLPVQLRLRLEHLEHLCLEHGGIRPLGLECLELCRLEHLRLEHRRLCRLAACLACRGNVLLCLAHRGIRPRHVRHELLWQPRHDLLVDRGQQHVDRGLDPR
mmetsp:Transcript_61805/g.148880  ORF Transcript_61805/g.148880 Transcript_61805/m.148880 type:complete len:232 (-) Transcript_61805:751-1446(-)